MMLRFILKVLFKTKLNLINRPVLSGYFDNKIIQLDDYLKSSLLFSLSYGYLNKLILRYHVYNWIKNWFFNKIKSLIQAYLFEY